MIAGAGGFLGTCLRFLSEKLGAAICHLSFPLGTFMANMVGCIIIGMLYGYLNKTGKVVEANSPYYYIIIGKPENVASVRNDIVAWCEGTDSYIASGDLGMNYKTPNYTIQSINNGVAHSLVPNNVITTYTREVSDTCSFVIRIDLSGYPSGYTAEQLDSCFMATATNSSGVNYEIIELEDEHNYKGQLKRRAFVDYLVKVYDFQLDDEVVEFSFNSEPLNDSFSSHFNEILSANNENPGRI